MLSLPLCAARTPSQQPKSSLQPATAGRQRWLAARVHSRSCNDTDTSGGDSSALVAAASGLPYVNNSRPGSVEVEPSAGQLDARMLRVLYDEVRELKEQMVVEVRQLKAATELEVRELKAAKEQQAQALKELRQKLEGLRRAREETDVAAVLPAWDGGEVVTEANAQPGFVVVRGPDWAWGDQDGGVGCTGRLLQEAPTEGWWWVEWDSTGKAINRYRVGGAHDLRLAAQQTANPKAEGSAAVAWDGGKVVTEANVEPGLRVVRGPDWDYNNAAGSVGDAGRLVGKSKDIVLRVSWPATGLRSYVTLTNDGNSQLCVAPSQNMARLPTTPRPGAPAVRVTTASARPGLVVVRGPDWASGDIDGGAGNAGQVQEMYHDGWWNVMWEATGEVFCRRVGAGGKYDLCLAPQQE